MIRSLQVALPTLAAIAMLTLAPLLAPAPALADDASEAELHWQLGSVLYGQRRYSAALDHFLAANRLAPNRGITLAIARTYRLLRRPADSFNWFETLLTELGDEMTQDERSEATLAQTELAPTLAIIRVETDPPGARLFLDREDLGSVGRSPRRLAVSPGEHTVVAQLDGHRAARTQVTAQVAETAPVSIEMAPILGALALTTEPPGALVRVEGRELELGTTPLETQLPVGQLTLSFTLDGFVSQTQIVNVRDGEQATLDLHLQRAASDLAVLTVRGDPEGALVTLDGQELGTLPLTRDDLHPGLSTIVVSAEGMEAYSTQLVLEAGAATRLELTLRPPPQWLWNELRWVGWGGAAVLGLTGAVMGGLATAERDQFFASPTESGYQRTGELAIASDVLLATALVALVVTVILELTLQEPIGSTGHSDLDR